jgi:hypothetical protein
VADQPTLSVLAGAGAIAGAGPAGALPGALALPFLAARMNDGPFEGAGLCFFLGALGAVVIAAVALGSGNGKQLNDAFARFARQFRGTFRPGDWADTPAVSFEHNTSSALLDVCRPPITRSGWCTQITFAFRRPCPVTMEIDPDGIDKPQLRMLRMYPMPVGDQAFDAGHRVHSSDRRLVRDLLTPAIREDLMRVRESLGAPVNICVSRDYLLVRFPRRIRDFNQLLVFAHVAFQVHDQLLLAVNQAAPDEVRIIEVSGIDGAAPDAARTGGSVAAAARTDAPEPGVTVTAAEPGEAPRCGVCGESVTEDKVLCRCCRAPHHRDCWDYNRGCSVYACRERTYIRPG